MKNFNDILGNRTRDLPVCSAVPQPTAPPRHFTAVQPFLTTAPASLTKHLIHCSVRHVLIVTVYCISMDGTVR
jgi:hypothetical protein